jgi:hypothetical protein
MITTIGLEFTMERYLVIQSQELDYHYIGMQFTNGVFISVFFLGIFVSSQSGYYP